MAGKEVLDARGREMCFLSLYDESGPVETVLFPKAWRRALPIFGGSGAYLVVGMVRAEQGALTLHVDELASLARDRSA
jgi:DNA polymerase III alpha subunit